ncbi:MAG TPA: DUF2953 domain-containing protein [Methanoregulaceae archaeon]|nr:DUF2953 domain-containing protein [Methanoregulaceae archaeon]
MDPFIIFLFLVLALACLAEFWILTTPLDFSVLLERNTQDTLLALVVSFGPAGFKNCLECGTWSHTLFLGRYAIHEFLPEEIYPHIPPKEGEGREEKEEKFDPGVFGVIVRHLPGLITDAWTVFIVGIRAVSFRSLDLDFRLGLSSPAITGQVFGYFSALRAILSPERRVSLAMTPEFGREVLEGRGNLSLRVNYPIRILAAIIRVMIGKNTRRLLRDLRRGGYLR